MKNFKINKEKIISLLMAGSIVLCTSGCARMTKEELASKATTNDEMAQAVTRTKDDSNIYINRNNVIVDLSVLNNNEYISIGDDNKYTLYNGANIYFKNDDTITNEAINENLIVVTVLEANSQFSKIQLPNGELAYVNNEYLIKCANLDNYQYTNVNGNNNACLLTDAYLYDANGMYIGFVKNNQACSIVKANGEYSSIVLDDGRSGYVLSIALSNTINLVTGFAYVKDLISLYGDKELTNTVCHIEANKVISINGYNEKYCSVIVDNHQYYVKTSDVLPKFIVIDIKEQRAACYNNYELIGCFKTRTGKLSTPTHEGVFDIDEKVENFAFTKYPGCYAKHWILFNEQEEEGAHDLAGDDEENYGNQSYQLNGSHGCVRIPAEASKFIYDNYDVGDIVIVIYDSQTLLYNVATNELIVIDTESFNKTRSR